MRVEESTQAASFILCWFFIQRGGFLHSACAKGLNDISERWFRLSTRVVSATFPGTAHRPFPTVSLAGGSGQPHRLYSERGGRQIAAPTIHLFRITAFLTYLSLYCVLSNWKNVVH